MAPPVVYVVVAVAAAAGLGYALYQLFRSDNLHIGSRVGRRRRENRNERRLVPPHSASPSGAGSDAVSTHEMREMRQSASQSSGIAARSFPPSTGLRSRRSNASGPDIADVNSSASGLMDGPSDNNIPITPLSPEPNPWSSLQASRARTTVPRQSPFEDRKESASAAHQPRQAGPSGSNEIIFDAADASLIEAPTHSAVQSPFELGSESPTLASPSPKTEDILLSESSSSASFPVASAPAALTDDQSPFEDNAGPATPRSASPELIPGDTRHATSPSRPAPPPIQLPTPSESVDEVISPTSSVSGVDREWTTVSPSASQNIQPPSLSASTSNAPLSQTLSPDVFAPPISRTATDTSASFFTAQSPGTEFRSFPPTEPTSPFSESFTLSGDESMYSFSSHADTDESLPAFAMPEEERNREGGLMFVVGGTATTPQQSREELSDSLSDTSGEGSSAGISDESWIEFSAPPTSPRH